MKIKNVLLISVLCFVFSSCITDINTNDIKPNLNLGTSLVLPIGNVHADMLYLLNMLDSTYIQSDSANGIYLLYEQKNIDLAVNLDTSFRKGEYLKETLTLRTEPCFNEIFNGIPSNIDQITLPSGSYKFGKETKYDLRFNKNKPEEIIQIDSAVIAQANVDFIIQVEGVELSEENVLMLSFNYPTLLSSEYDHLFEDIPITQNRFSLSETLYRFMAHFDELEEGNLIDLIINFNLISTGTTTISRNARLTFETEINLINTHEVYGFVWYRDPIEQGNIAYEIPQDIFDNKLLRENNLLFSNPQIELSVTTNACLPLRLEINNVYATAQDKTEHASFNGKDYSIYDLVVPSEPFDSATTIITLNREHGSLHKLLSILPEKINLDYKVTTPVTQKGDNPQFLILPLLSRLNVQAKLPFKFDPTTHFSYRDTLAADFASLIGTNSLNSIDVDSINLYLDIANSLPINATIQLYYLNETGNIITQSNPLTITSGVIDAEGRVILPTTENHILSITGDDIEEALATKQIIIDVMVEGRDEQSCIYFQTTDAIDIKLGAFFKANISTQESNN